MAHDLFLVGNYAMYGFLRATFSRQKIQGLFISTALGNFASYVAGSLVTLVCTRHVLERRAIGNLFGVLPRKQIVVHQVPPWLEWLLALIVGFLVMEAVRYWFNHRKYAALLGALRPKGGTESNPAPDGPEAVEQCGAGHPISLAQAYTKNQ
jgi:Na+/proline symporter